jgi:hypothetical protein
MAFGIFVRFGLYVLMNRTTIEDLQRIHPRHCVAVRVHESEFPRRTETIGPDRPPPFFYVPYPFPTIYGNNGTNSTQNRTFYAILMPKQGMNFWDLGYWENFKSIMGYHAWDWFLPLSHSPCRDHSNGFSDFQLGKDFEELERTYLPHRYDKDGKRKLGEKEPGE